MHKLFFSSSIFLIFVGFYFIGLGIVNHDGAIEFKKIKVKSLNQIVSENIVTNNNSKFTDSKTVNKLFSEKNTELVDTELVDNFKLDIKNKRILINIKSKPINPKNIKLSSEFSLASLNKKNLEGNYDFTNLTKSKKDFINTLLPLISYENQKILIERKYIKKIKDNLTSNKTLSNEDLKYISKIASKYKIKTNNKHKIDLLEEILISVDIIPNSIVLAQAANESGWGKSRFAREYNAVFGEYTYNFSEGVIPLKRDLGKKHLVKTFSSFDKSVESYFININTHRAYEKFRLTRKAMKQQDISNIDLLVQTLDSYAEDSNYVNTISSIIRSNKLYRFDQSNYIPSIS